MAGHHCLFQAELISSCQGPTPGRPVMISEAKEGTANGVDCRDIDSLLGTILQGTRALYGCFILLGFA